jgi:DNA-binding GntR family transcriptional regulator/AraC-like DNA-binding protein
MHSPSSLMVATTIGRQIALEISSGTRLPGEVIDLDSVASEFSTPRAEVLRAVVELSEKGLLCIDPDHGIVVSRLSISEFLATMELLAELEGSCAKLAARRLSRADANAIQGVHQASRECERAGDVLRYGRANAAFHEILYRACGNDALVQEISRIRARTQVYRRSPFQSRSRIRNSWNEHGRILQAVLAGEDLLAAERMVEHISVGAQELTAHLLQPSTQLLNFDSDFPGRRTLAAWRVPAARPAASSKQEAISRPAPQPVTQTVRSYILSRQCFKATLEQAADELGMSKRTLTRQLSVEGTTFQALKDDIRREQAVEMIRNSTEPIAQIAHDLGFSDASSFYRAFRNWTGTTPSARGASGIRRENPET